MIAGNAAILKLPEMHSGGVAVDVAASVFLPEGA